MPLAWAAARAAAIWVAEAHDLVEVQPAAREPGRQRLSVDELHDQVVRPDVVERADVGVVERRNGAHFALEAVGEGVLCALDRHGTIQPGVGPPIDLTHPAAAEKRHDLVRTDSHPGCQSHGAEIIEKWRVPPGARPAFDRDARDAYGAAARADCGLRRHLMR